jgi:hypothetical protein
MLVVTMRSIAPYRVPPVTTYLIDHNWLTGPPLHPAADSWLCSFCAYNFALRHGSCSKSNLVPDCPEMYKSTTTLTRTHQTRRSKRFSRMKSALIFVAAISGINGVYSSPAARGTQVDIIRSPTVPEPDIERSINLNGGRDSLAASVTPWACIVVNTANRNYGDGLGTSQVQALATAVSACPGDCEALRECVSKGCVAYAAGPLYVSLYLAAGFGSQQADQTTAENGALTKCQAHSPNCAGVVTLCTSDAD